MALAFPDVYEVGMSHTGLRVLYSIVNNRPEFWAERVFAPWPDMERAMRRSGVPLTTLESGTPLSKMDVVGFSLQYELCATTVLQMLDLAGVPLVAEQRTESDPLVIAGGPGTFNPAPMARFFDAMVIGEGEELILELADVMMLWKREGGSRRDLLAAWKELPGVYVPSLHCSGEKVTRRIVANLESAAMPTRPVVPFCDIVHDRIGLEIARGCTRGCRFCQAGMLYRPVRERNPGTIVKRAGEALQTTGWDEVSLLSLSSGDYSRIGELVHCMIDRFGKEMVAVSLPSLRTETLDTHIARAISSVRKTGFTLAPEAGTDRLRAVINKGNSEADLERAVRSALLEGWQGLKLYFMIGLPTETDQDLDGIVDLIRKASRWFKGKKITASVSTFVPKPHTPFQWAPQLLEDEIKRRQMHIKQHFRGGPARVKYHDFRTSMLEGIVARGDSRVAMVIERAFKGGARFDGWDEHLVFDAWVQALGAEGVDLNTYPGPRQIDEPLPWDLVDPGVSREFLKEEWKRALAREPTLDCRFGACAGCGVCDFEKVRPITVQGEEMDLPSDIDEQPVAVQGMEVVRFRFRYSKTGAMRFLGHQDLSRAFYRAFRRVGLKLVYSQGFHPHPKIRFSPPVPLGVESLAEFVEIDLMEAPDGPAEVLEALRRELPPGLAPRKVEQIPLNEPPISARIQQFTYQIRLPESFGTELIAARIQTFREARTFEITREHKGKTTVRDLKEWVEDVSCSDGVLVLVLRSGPTGSVNPLHAAAGVLGINPDEVRAMSVVKIAAGLK